MKVLTILSHGTLNSTNRETSEGNELVISRIATRLSEFENFKLNQGVGTQELRDEGVVSETCQAIANGQGVEENVTRSVAWIRTRKSALNDEITVNLAGHSRGSITCYKIAHRLSTADDLFKVRVNIFAIDPVPGNTGNIITRNGANYEDIVLRGNEWAGNSFLMLAESEHRMVYRPYIDALYGLGLPNHEFDTIPGTHGGINMLLGYEREAASLVLSRALAFLKANGSPLKAEADNDILSEVQRLELYAKLMDRVKKYKAHATLNPLKKHSNSWEAVKNFVQSGLPIDPHRIANVKGSKADFGVTAGQDGPAGRRDFHGLNVAQAVGRMAGKNGAGQAHTTRAHRFFCNFENETLFRKRYPALAVQISAFENAKTGDMAKLSTEIALYAARPEYNSMTVEERNYLKTFLRAQGIKRGLVLVDA